MNDDQADRLAHLILNLACALRDDNPDDTAQLAARILDGATAVQALAVAAALIDVDRPVNRWWQQGLAGLRPAPTPTGDATDEGKRLKPCGTRAAYERHKNRGEPIDTPCRSAYDDWLADMREARARYREGAA